MSKIKTAENYAFMHSVLKSNYVTSPTLNNLGKCEVDVNNASKMITASIAFLKTTCCCVTFTVSKTVLQFYGDIFRKIIFFAVAYLFDAFSTTELSLKKFYNYQPNYAFQAR